MDSISAPASLLILASKEEEVERTVANLRNGGLAVRGIHSDDPQQIDDLVRRKKIDLILCCEYDEKIDIVTCMEAYGNIEGDIPLILVTGAETDPSDLIDAMRNGARDLIEQGSRERLQLAVARELSDLRARQSIEELRERIEACEQRSKQAMNASDEAVAFIHEGMLVQANPSYCELFGFETDDDLVGYTLLDLVAADAQKELRKSLRSLNAGKDSESTVTTTCVRTDDSHFDARFTLSKSNYDGEPCIRAVVRKSEDTQASAAPQLQDLDTGLPNFAALLGELATRLNGKEPGGDRVGIIYVGVGAYAQIVQNESLSSGFQAMNAFGKSLHELVPAGTFVARVCDNGFAVLLDDVKGRKLIETSSTIAAEARLPSAQRSTKGDEPICDTGAMLAEPGKDSPTEAVDAAYRDYMFGAMSASSGHDAGPSSSRVSSKTRSESGANSEPAGEEQLLVSQINRALTGDGFQFVYQPIVSVKGDSQENYNLFLRLQDEDKGLIEAKEFLGAAVRSEHMVQVDRWVIEHAIEELAKQRGQDRKINFFIDLAEETLQEEQLLVWICDQLGRCQVRGNWLTFQIRTDHARMHSAAFSKLQEGLRKVKCRVALSRFGYGDNPEVLLRNLHADFVKFAPELAGGLADDEDKQQRLSELTAVAQEQEMRTVVTGVEDARTLTVLWSAGVDYVQGNFLQKPTPTIEPQ